jgi:hypothetical protein
MAIRNNHSDVQAMSQQTMAILKHYTDLPTDTRHEDCPSGLQSWCKHQVDIVRGDGVITFQEVKNPLSTAIYEVLLPIFTDLSSTNLLAGCGRGLTQNANESLHHCIWNIVPKDMFHSPAEVSLGIDMAVPILTMDSCQH